MSNIPYPHDHPFGHPDHALFDVDPAPQAASRTRELASFEVRIDWTPQRRPIGPGFAKDYAHKRGLSTTIRGPAAPQRGWLMEPEEIIHNDTLREAVEADQARFRLRSFFAALCVAHVNEGEAALGRSGALNISRQPGFAHEGATCHYRTRGSGECGRPAEYDVDYDRWVPIPCDDA